MKRTSVRYFLLPLFGRGFGVSGPQSPETTPCLSGAIRSSPMPAGLTGTSGGCTSRCWRRIPGAKKFAGDLSTDRYGQCAQPFGLGAVAHLYRYLPDASLWPDVWGRYAESLLPVARNLFRLHRRGERDHTGSGREEFAGYLLRNSEQTIPVAIATLSDSDPRRSAG